MLILAAVFVVAAIVLFLIAQNSAGAAKRLAATATVECREVKVLADSHALVEVTGTGVSGPDGLLQAPLSGRPCLWYRVLQEEEYWQDDTNDNSNNPTRQTQTLSDDSSRQDFGVKDATGRVLIKAQDVHVDSPQQSFNDFQNSGAGLNIQLSAGIQLGSQGQTNGVRRTEWLIAENTTLFVSGAAAIGSRGPEIGRPQKGKLIVSTKSEAELTASLGRKKTICFALSGVCAVVGVILLIAGL